MPTYASRVTLETTNAAAFETRSDDVFGRIATRYDLLCDLFSFGIHRLWKRRVAARIAAEPWQDLLDSASGTGHIILRVSRHHALAPGQRIIASDISAQMLAIAKRNAAGLKQPPEFRILDAHAMPEIPDASIDLYSISLGLKICDRRRVLLEALRVLKPGGRLIALEASNIRPAWLQRAYLLYMRLVMPTLGWLATGGDASAYRYLLEGIENFPTAEALAAEIRDLGYEDVNFERLSLGIVAIHSARKPR
jgi:demethylmenaquinone methyltransferase/2-methoxy-6-polyprenyl-1,4-benzoquinol methylase